MRAYSNMLSNQPLTNNMANPYNLLWPYFHNVSTLNYNNTEIPMFQAPLPSQIGPVCNDANNLSPGEHNNIITNIAFQQQQKQQHQQQQQLQFYQQQQIQQLQQQNVKIPVTHQERDIYLRKFGYEFGTNINSSRSPLISNKHSLDNDKDNNDEQSSNENNINNNINDNTSNSKTNTKCKKGSSFTIDFILSNTKKDKPEKETTTDDESLDNNSPTTPMSPTMDDPPYQKCYSPRNNTHSPNTSVDNCNPQGPLTILPVMHSTPNAFHSEKARFSRRHERFNEYSHPYFHKQLDFLNQHAPSFQFHHPNHHELQQDQQHQHPHHHQQLHQSHIISHPIPPHPHQQHNSPRNSLTSSTSDSPSTTFSSSSAESMTSPRNETKDGKISNKTKRIRTIFTPEQLERLEAEFERQQYMVGTERFYLASSLNLTEAQVKVWFQNRRIKWRKQHLEQQQARLAQGDLYRDLDESDDESEVERENEAMSSVSMMSSSGSREDDEGRPSFHQHHDNSVDGDSV